jgi:hypothetical protein
MRFDGTVIFAMRLSAAFQWKELALQKVGFGVDRARRKKK